MRGRLAGLRREVQVAFGASLLGVATASCVAEPRTAQSLTPKAVLPVHDFVEVKPTAGKGAQQSTESVPKPDDAGTKQAPAASGDPWSPDAMVPIYGESSVAIHNEVEYSRNSLVIDAEGERTLAALKELLDAFDCDMLIQGHSGRDEAKAAEWLSKRRAELVRERLIALGVDRKRLSVEARGASPLGVTSPRAPGRDRRVSFLFQAKSNGIPRACDESDRRAQ
jgi:outer membrane protein OmpA-like peptidoglycan-associated protein